MWALLLYFSLFHIASGSCPDGFDLAHEGECRGLLTTMYLYHDEAYAKTVGKCAEVQATPVIIHSEEQQYYWMGRQKQQPSGNLILGLTCNINSKKWEWSDRSALDYQPPNGSDEDLNHDCTSGCSVYMWSDGHWHVWCDKNSENVNIFCTSELPPIPTPSGDGCQSFEDDSEDGLCYQVGDAARNWQDAQTACRSIGADLAYIHNDKENSFIRRLAVSKGAVNGVFLAGVIPANDNNFMWTDGSTWDYDNSYPGVPVSGQGNCLAMNTSDTAGQWFNTNCASLLPAACQRPQGFSPPSCSSGKLKEGDIIFSPGFPFDASVPCDYTLLVAAGKKVQVEVLFLEANSCCDYLNLYNDSDGKKLLAAYTGEMQNTLSPTSSSNLMKVSWKPSGGVNVRGMMMTFRGV